MSLEVRVLDTSLTGQFVELLPIAEVHRAELVEAASNPRIWRNTPLGPSFDDYFDTLLELRASGAQVPFAVRSLVHDRLIGGTRFMDIVPVHNRLEIGGTWYHPDFWGGPTNPEAKYLLLGQAFERAGANRVQLLTDVLNPPSQSAIATLGGRREGVLRSHMIVDGARRRDSVAFSIVKEEWPEVAQGLRARLDAFANQGNR
jgi:RimJ/RimL family protein N-acetyltransferase